MLVYDFNRYLKSFRPDLLINFYGNLFKEIKGVEIDSRKVNQDFAFICLKGQNVDGHQFINQAIQNGASFIIVEELPKEININVTYFHVADSNELLWIFSNFFYNFPTQQLNLIGITGTNGKTTTSNIIEYVLQYHKKKIGIIGTINIRYDDYIEPSSLTTPFVHDTLRHFSNMKKRNVNHAVMEVSSHSLSLGRVYGFHFKTAIFTNLSQDHLDFHKTMDEYKKTKGLLFSGDEVHLDYPDNVILNRDDDTYKYYDSIAKSHVYTYGIKHPCDIRASEVQLLPTSSSFKVTTNREEVIVNTNLIGKFNVYNTLGAIACCLLEGLTLVQIKEALQSLQGVDGRMQSISAGQDFSVIIDFAHTPDGLFNVLSSLRNTVKGRIFTVVGCGGNRDRMKRPIMAQIAEDFSFHTIFTSDNPRNEDPNLIIKDMLEGLRTSNYVSIVDRKEAIQYALSLAKKDDCVLIAGKGHEPYQIIGDVKIDFDDRIIAKDFLSFKYNSK